MTIEVRQLVVKSTVLDRNRHHEMPDTVLSESEEIKAEILAECKEMLIALLQEREER